MKIGITGHQDLGSQQKYNEIANKLNQIISGNPITFGFTCLAKGADQLFAETLMKDRIPYCAVIPSDNYEDTFTDKETLEKYQLLIKNAEQEKILSFNQPEEKAFYEAGKYVADSSDLLIAIWNGEDSKGLGGTADIVNYCLRLKKPVIHLDTSSLEINNL